MSSRDKKCLIAKVASYQYHTWSPRVLLNYTLCFINVCKRRLNFIYLLFLYIYGLDLIGKPDQFPVIKKCPYTSVQKVEVDSRIKGNKKQNLCNCGINFRLGSTCEENVSFHYQFPTINIDSKPCYLKKTKGVSMLLVVSLIDFWFF